MKGSSHAIGCSVLLYLYLNSQVWPSVKNEDPTEWDPRTFHEAMPVIKGTKYAANHWIHMNDYEGPNQWGCTGSFS